VFLINKKIGITVIISILFLSITNLSYCATQSDQSQDTAYTREFGVFTGWARGDLKTQDNYEMIPLHLQIGFDITSYFNKINIRPKGNIKFIVEPFLSTIVSPRSNIEVGNNFILKYCHPITRKVSMYFEGGLGIMFTSLHTFEQGTQFNFTEQFGTGFSYLFSKNKAINFGYRYRHFSNAGIKEPNAGIDMHYFLCGVSISY